MKALVFGVSMPLNTYLCGTIKVEDHPRYVLLVSVQRHLAGCNGEQRQTGGVLESARQ